MDTDEFIAATMRRVADAAVPAGDTSTPNPTRRWVAPVGVAAAVGTVLLIVAAASTLGSHSTDGGSPATSPSSPPMSAGCRVDYTPTPLPEWARTGFSPPEQPMPYVLSDRGDMVAILWADHHPLSSPPAADRNNKILWVAKVGPGDGALQIRATSTSTGKTVTRNLDTAPGPSIIDLPAAGCWSLDLRWGSHQDHLMLGYAAN